MAPGIVNKSFKKALRSNLEKYNTLVKKLTSKNSDDIAYGDNETLKNLKFLKLLLKPQMKMLRN